MNEISHSKPFANSLLSGVKGITKVEDETDHRMARAKVYFENGEVLSIIFGDSSYGSEDGLFEIMCNPRFYNDYDPDNENQDGVKGRLTANEVKEYIRKIAQSPKKNKGHPQSL